MGDIMCCLAQNDHMATNTAWAADRVRMNILTLWDSFTAMGIV